MRQVEHNPIRVNLILPRFHATGLGEKEKYKLTTCPSDKTTNTTKAHMQVYGVASYLSDTHDDPRKLTQSTLYLG